MNPYLEIETHFVEWTKGDDRSFKIIFDYFYPKFFSLALKVTKCKEDAEELTMNTLMKTWQNRYHFEHIRQFDNYLFGILRQQIAGFLRKKSVKTTSIEGANMHDLVTSNDTTISFKELQECYRNALTKLSPRQKEIFLMSREEYLSNKEISDSTGLSIHTINNHIKSSLKIIKLEFQHNPNELIGFAVLASHLALN